VNSARGKKGVIRGFSGQGREGKKELTRKEGKTEIRKILVRSKGGRVAAGAVMGSNLSKKREKRNPIMKKRGEKNVLDFPSRGEISRFSIKESKKKKKQKCWYEGGKEGTKTPILLRGGGDVDLCLGDCITSRGRKRDKGEGGKAE